MLFSSWEVHIVKNCDLKMLPEFQAARQAIWSYVARKALCADTESCKKNFPKADAQAM